MYKRIPSLAICLLGLGMLSSYCKAELLTQSEGAAVANTALRYGQSFRSDDCSHLAHDVYQMAGLPYTYANSTSLYNGDNAFERVETPQPGDLVVWRGHVGIVVDPDDTSSYSSLSTGPGIDSYQSRYWLSRGAPRFYRYQASGDDRPHTVTASAPISTPKPSVKRASGSFVRTIGKWVLHSGRRRNLATSGAPRQPDFGWWGGRSAAIAIGPAILARVR